MAVLSPYRPKWRPEAHVELKSGVEDGKKCNLAHIKLKTASNMHDIALGHEENKAGVI